MVWKGRKTDTRSEGEVEVVSHGRREIPKSLIVVMSRALDSGGFEIVDGRRRTVSWTG